MIDQSRILYRISETTKLINIKIDEEFNFDSTNDAFIISEGSVLSIGDRNLTQILNDGDPIGFAEAILAKKNLLRYRRYTDLKLIKIDGSLLRKEVNNAHIVVKSIIKYNLARIFGNSNSKARFLLEEKFIRNNENFLNKREFEPYSKIFLSEHEARSMYFIEEGAVSLFTKNNRKLANLKSGDTFGESALIAGRSRNNSAITSEKTVLIQIDAKRLSAQVANEKPLVQLALLNVIKRLDLSNQMKFADDFAKK